MIEEPMDEAAKCRMVAKQCRETAQNILNKAKAAAANLIKQAEVYERRADGAAKP